MRDDAYWEREEKLWEQWKPEVVRGVAATITDDESTFWAIVDNAEEWLPEAYDTSIEATDAIERVYDHEAYVKAAKNWLEGETVGT